MHFHPLFLSVFFLLSLQGYASDLVDIDPSGKTSAQASPPQSSWGDWLKCCLPPAPNHFVTSLIHGTQVSTGLLLKGIQFTTPSTALGLSTAVLDLSTLASGALFSYQANATANDYQDALHGQQTASSDQRTLVNQLTSRDPLPDDASTEPAQNMGFIPLNTEDIERRADTPCGKTCLWLNQCSLETSAGFYDWLQAPLTGAHALLITSNFFISSLLIADIFPSVHHDLETAGFLINLTATATTIFVAYAVQTTKDRYKKAIQIGDDIRANNTRITAEVTEKRPGFFQRMGRHLGVFQPAPVLPS